MKDVADDASLSFIAKGNSRGIKGDESTTLDDIEPETTMLVTAGALMFNNPLRFVSRSTTGKEKDFVWDRSHEDWYRAFWVLHVASRRRLNSPPLKGKMQSVPSKKDASTSFGYITEDLIEKSKGNRQSSQRNPSNEDTTSEPVLFVDQDQDVAADEEVNALSLVSVRRSDEDQAQDHLNDKDLNESQVEDIANAPNASSTGTRSAKFQHQKITAKCRSRLKGMLESRIRVTSRGQSSPDMARDDHLLATAQTIAEPLDNDDSDDIDADSSNDQTTPEERDTSSEEQKEEIEFQKQMALSGENLPPNTNLEEICSRRGIPLDTYAVNPISPEIRALPPQVPGKLALRMSVNQRANQHRCRSYRPAAGLPSSRCHASQ